MVVDLWRPKYALVVCGNEPEEEPIPLGTLVTPRELFTRRAAQNILRTGKRRVFDSDEVVGRQFLSDVVNEDNAKYLRLISLPELLSELKRAVDKTCR